jgi:hypothetical protein
VSGGDDNSLYGTLLKNPTEPCKVGWCTAASGLHPHAHCSSITGTWYMHANVMSEYMFHIS